MRRFRPGSNWFRPVPARAREVWAVATRTRILYKELLSLLILFIYLMNVAWAVEISFFGGAGWELLVLAVPYALLYIMRRRAGQGLSFYPLMGLALAAFVVAFGVTGENITAGFLILLMAAHSVVARNTGEFEPGFGSAAVYAALHAILLLFLEPDGRGFELRVLLSYALQTALIFVYVHMNNFDLRLYVHRNRNPKAAAMPAGRLASANGALALGFAALALAVGTAAVLLPLRALGGILGRNWLALAGALRGWVAGLATGGAPRPLQPPPAPGFDSNGHPAAAEILDGLPEFVGNAREITWEPMLAAMAAIALFIAGAAVFAFVRSRDGAGGRQDPDGFSESAIHGGGSALSDIRSLLPSFARLHPVRRAYRKKVAGHMRGGVRVARHDTAGAILAKIRAREDIGGLTGKYEEIRYGNGGTA